MEFNERQREAINSRENEILVSAGAGSGKTAVLAQRVISLITDEDAPADISRLLIITFTNLATDEMRERIGKAITDAKNKCTDKKRREHLAGQLNSLNMASISTIDAFFSDVVKKNFRSADIDPSFRIGEDYEIEKLRSDILSEIYERRYEKEREKLCRLTDLFTTKTDESELFSVIDKIQRMYFKTDDFDSWLEKAFAPYCGVMEAGGIFASSFSKSVFFYVNELKEFLVSGIKSYPGDAGEIIGLPLVKKDIAAVCGMFRLLGGFEMTDEPSFSDLEACAFGEDVCLDKEKYTELSRFIFSLELNLPRGMSDWVKNFHGEFRDKIKSFDAFPFSLPSAASELRKGFAAAKKIKDEAEKAEYIQNWREAAAARVDDFLDLVISQGSYAAEEFSLLKEIISEYNRELLKEKKENSVFEFGDITVFCYQIMKNVPEVAEEYARKYDEIIVDEFQDSDYIQEYIFSCIHKGNRRFSVGDAKQSIYAFRGADVGIFTDKYESSGDIKKIYMNTNYRSRECVINFVNYIFGNLMTKKLGGIDYDENAALSAGLDYSAYEDEPHNYCGSCEAHIYKLDKNSPSTPEAEAEVIAGRINSFFEDKLFVFDKELSKMREIRFSDIAIIMRSKTPEYIEPFLAKLSALGVPYYYSDEETSDFFKSFEISLVVSVLKITDNPMCDIEFAAVLNSPLVGLSEDDIVGIRKVDYALSLYAAAREYVEKEPDSRIGGILGKFLQRLEKWRYLSLNMPVAEFVTYIYRETKIYEAIGISRTGDIRRVNLNLFSERAAAFSENNMGTLFDFLVFIRTMEENYTMKAPADASKNAVSVMTVHKSKGLEFPVVFVSNIAKEFSRKEYRKDNKVIADKELGLGFCVYMPTQIGKEAEASEYAGVIPRYAHMDFYREYMTAQLTKRQYSEEMRILYVAATRAREKLIFVGCYRNCGGYLKWLGDVFKAYSETGAPFVYESNEADAAAEEETAYPTFEGKVASEGKDDENISVYDNLKKIAALSAQLSAEKEKLAIKSILESEYFGKQDTLIPSSISVSEIKKQHLEKFDADTDGFINFSDGYYPFNEKIKGSERGTAYHTVMEHLDFNIKGEKEIKELISELEKRRLLTAAQARSVNVSEIAAFLSSDVCQNVLMYSGDDRLHREQAFTMQMSPGEIYVNSPEYRNCRKKILVHGKIDLYCEKTDGKLLLLDYKTDRFLDENGLKERYSVQLDVYKKALEKATKKEVSDVYIYHFGKSKLIRVEL